MNKSKLLSAYLNPMGAVKHGGRRAIAVFLFLPLAIGAFLLSGSLSNDALAGIAKGIAVVCGVVSGGCLLSLQLEARARPPRRASESRSRVSRPRYTQLLAIVGSQMVLGYVILFITVIRDRMDARLNIPLSVALLHIVMFAIAVAVVVTVIRDIQVDGPRMAPAWIVAVMLLMPIAVPAYYLMSSRRS